MGYSIGAFLESRIVRIILTKERGAIREMPTADFPSLRPSRLKFREEITHALDRQLI